MNEIERIISSTSDIYYHLFELDIDTSTDEVTFYSYKEVTLSKPFTVEKIYINSIERTKLVIKHPNNSVQIGDDIKINGAKSTNGISSTILNSTHTVIEIDTNLETYTILLPKYNASISTTDTAGGENVVIRVDFLVRMFFNNNNSIGKILGFRDVGQDHAVTRFSSKISNVDTYELEGVSSVNFNSAGLEKKIGSNILNFTGDNLYIYMVINDYSNIITSNEINNAFAKILLSGIPGDILFDTFVASPKIFDQPISQLNEIKVQFLYPDGGLVDFNNINHSFTLSITERTIRPNNTLMNTRFKINNESYINLEDDIQ